MQITKKTLRLSLLAALAGSGTTSFAGGLFPTLPEALEREWSSHQVIPSSRLTSPAFGLSGANAIDRHKAVRQFLGGRGIHPLLNLVERPSDYLGSSAGFALDRGRQFKVREYSLRVGKYEICRSDIRTVETPDGGIRILGVAPNVEAVYPFADDAWTSLEESITVAVDNLRLKGVATAALSLSASSRCVYPVQNELHPAWRLVIRASGLPYVIYVSNSEVIDGDPLYFDATGYVTAYDSNPSFGTLKRFDVTVNGDGYMTNQFFSVVDGGDNSKVYSASNTFDKAPGTRSFAQQSAFAHVNVHHEFAVGVGYSWKGPAPLTVKTQVVLPDGDVNNALYSPYDGASGPFILIGEGDGVIFQNLPFDSDVVSHEFGHHIIFGSVTDTRGESLIIHEGLADAITFTRSGDACLGESICPSSGTKCQVKGQCLRTANNTMKYKDAAYLSAKGAHIQGQLVSGLIWDLRKNGSIPASDLSKLVIAMVTFLPSKADMPSLITALLDADYAMFNQQYQAAIVNAASARGLGLDTLGVQLASIDGRPPSTSSSSSKSESGKGFLGLCSIGSESVSVGSATWIGIAMLLPLLAQLIARRPQPRPVKATKKTR